MAGLPKEIYGRFGFLFLDGMGDGPLIVTTIALKKIVKEEHNERVC
ncbi:MAG: hypothetical protein WAV13_10340 [Thermodesulfovibrionales bacterium]